MKPLALDLCCGLGGWTEGLLAAGWDVIGLDFDTRFIGRYPARLIIQDMHTFCGRRARGKISLVVASPDCREASYRAMPWKRAKQLNAEGPPHQFIKLFSECFRIADEIGCPVIVENVKGAQPWVGSAKWHYGSFYLWGDVPALMPIPFGLRKVQDHEGVDVPKGTGKSSWFFGNTKHELRSGFKGEGGSWFNVAHNTNSGVGNNPVNGVKGSGGGWFGKGNYNPANGRAFSSGSKARKEASAQIAKIPFPLAHHIGKVFHP